jgi:two-component system, LytTR family, response regulator
MLSMQSLRVLIVDDEPLIRSGIRAGLSSMASVEIAGECGSGTQAIEAISRHKPDLVLLDVQMPDCNGLEVIQRVGVEHMPAVVFITAYDEYAVQAFELNAVDYLLKPFDEARLRASIARAQQRIGRAQYSELSAQLHALLNFGQRKWPERIVVRNGERYDFVPIDAIDWIESANNYVQIHCGSREHLLGETLSSIEKRLDPDKFLRIHRCRIVNLTRVVAVYPLLGGAYSVELRGGLRLNSGRQYREALQKLCRQSSLLPSS